MRVEHLGRTTVYYDLGTYVRNVPREVVASSGEKIFVRIFFYWERPMGLLSYTLCQDDLLQTNDTHKRVPS